MSIQTLITLFDWRSLIDIPILSFIVFLFYTTLRSSGSWRIGLGIIVALLFYLIARFIRLPGVEWVFNNVSNIALIALIVIFQPEIRKIFERAASTFKVKKLLKESSGFFTEIAKATFVLAQKRWGAIIVIPGKDEVENKINGGFIINAEVSVPLIVSIFDPHSPGHDGAMLVENAKIVGFGFRLPLSSSETLDYRFGTRHHASLGLSEACDALIITVSEERGTVSVFHTGSYIQADSEEKLEREIKSHLQNVSLFFPITTRRRSKSIRLAEAFMSLIVGCCIWLAIAINASQVVQRTYTIPVQYNLPPKMVIIGEKPQTVRISVSGSASEIESIRAYELKAFIDLIDVSPGEHSVNLQRKNFNVSNDVNIIDIEPPQLKLVLHTMQQRDVEIKPQLVGSLPPGYEITSIDVSPSKIPVLYTTYLENPDDIYLTTAPIYINCIQQSVKLTTKIVAPQGVYPLDISNWPDVTVNIYVHKK
ncbi:MAG: diadenylate cyclase [Spirochaetota bacterium]|nr:diadenylate cyclase [Spirochaetota bacterium]